MIEIYWRDKMWKITLSLHPVCILLLWSYIDIKWKYNNAKRSIPAHPTFVNNLDLWPLTSKRNRVHPLIIVNMSAKFDRNAHNGWVSNAFTRFLSHKSMLTLTFDLWPPKSIGFILLPCLTCLQSLTVKQTTFQSPSCSQCYFHIRQLWPWPLHLTSKINRVHPLVIINMSAKFDEDAHNGSVSIVLTRLLLLKSIVALTFDLWPPKSIGFILSSYWICLQSLMKMCTTLYTHSRSQG